MRYDPAEAKKRENRMEVLEIAKINEIRRLRKQLRDRDVRTR